MVDSLTAFSDVARKFRIELCRQVYRPCSRYVLQPATTWRGVSGRKQKELSGLAQVPLFQVFLCSKGIV